VRADGSVSAVELHGHRGARGLFPENTIEGIAGALAVGVDVIELDVAVTADQVVVVSHDPALNPDITRTADGAWLASPGPLIHRATAKSLAAYDVGRIRPGTAYAASHPDQVPVDGARIPTLAAVLCLDPTARFSIEMKTDPQHSDRTEDAVVMADRVIAVIDASGAVGATGRVRLQSFDWRGLRHVRRIRPDIPLAWLTCAARVARSFRCRGGAIDASSVPRAVAAEGGPAWSPEYVDLSAATLDEAHGLGLVVVPWTINRAEDMSRLLRWGVDGLVTDRPDIARAVFAAHGLRLPPRRKPALMAS
jgi:glycerophosphoryl diester phosphodiesterase